MARIADSLKARRLTRRMVEVQLCPERQASKLLAAAQRCHMTAASNPTALRSPTLRTALDAQTAQGAAAAFELYFDSLFVGGRGMSFPCDAGGRVEAARLSQRAMHSYRHALSALGREYRVPAVRRCEPVPH